MNRCSHIVRADGLHLVEMFPQLFSRPLKQVVVVAATEQENGFAFVLPVERVFRPGPDAVPRARALCDQGTRVQQHEHREEQPLCPEFPFAKWNHATHSIVRPGADRMPPDAGRAEARP